MSTHLKPAEAIAAFIIGVVTTLSLILVVGSKPIVYHTDLMTQRECLTALSK